MGTIQQSVNNALVTGTALASLNPGLQQKAKDRAELKKLDAASELNAKKKEALDKKWDEYAAQRSAKVPTTINPEALLDIGDDIESEKLDLAAKKYELNPNDKNMSEYTDLLGSKLSRESQIKAFRDQKRMQDANMSAENQSAIRQQQRDAFEARINSMRTSLGVDVGDLPENIRQQIIAAYGGNK